MRNWILNLSLILFVSLGLFIPAARAQNMISLSSAEVDIWPEYDRPTVLVIYRLTLSSDTTLPVEMTVRIPAAAGEPNAVAVKQITSTSTGSDLFQIASNRVVNGDWGLITFTATMPEVQIEYYDPELTKQGADRHFEYHWAGDYSVDSLVIQVQQPVGAANMQISPASDSSATGQDGLVYYNKRVGALTAGQTFNLTVDYQKSSDSLSIESLAIQPSAPVANVTSGWKSQVLAVLPWVLGVVGILLIVGGGWWYWQSGKGGDGARRPAVQPRRRRRSTAVQGGGDTGTEGYVYCHQCGKRASPNDRFCRACGTRLRVE